MYCFGPLLLLLSSGCRCRSVPLSTSGQAAGQKNGCDGRKVCPVIRVLYFLECKHHHGFVVTCGGCEAWSCAAVDFETNCAMAVPLNTPYPNGLHHAILFSTPTVPAQGPVCVCVVVRFCGWVSLFCIDVHIQPLGCCLPVAPHCHTP